MIMNNSGLKPNLFIIGASKAGSSALHAYLNYHPDIQMSSEKEPCFFVNQSELHNIWPIMARQPCSHVWNSYLNLWEGGEHAKYRGEASVYYSQSSNFHNVPERIAAECPDAKIIYNVREPVSRSISHYWQRYKEFQEEDNLDLAVKTNPIYRDTSDYAMQMQAYLQYFKRSQIHIVFAERLRNQRREVLNEIFEWLDLEHYTFTETQIIERHVSSNKSRKARFPIVKHARNSKWWMLARNYLPHSVVKNLRQISTTGFEKDSVDESSTREYLKEYFRPRTKLFETLLGHEITEWK